MSVFDVFSFDSALLNSPVAIAQAVRSVYRSLRRGRRVTVRVRGARREQALRWLAHALEQAGIPFGLADHGASHSSSSAASVQLEVSSEPPQGDVLRTPAASAPLRIVLLGLGTVGLGVYRHLSQRPELFDVRRVVVRDLDKHRDDGVPAERLATNLWLAINEPADLVIELIGGVEPAGDVVHAALLRGRTVITANKALVATRWGTFERYVCTPQPRLRFSAAVGGSLPVLETVERLATEQSIERVRAVINGTCNFVLDELAQGATLADAIALAQRHGFAEADPSVDLSGMDAAQKLSLIARAAFGSAPDPWRISCQGIEYLTPQTARAAQARGERIRLVASCTNERGAIRAQVRPEALAASDYLAGAHREENRVEIAAGNETSRLAGKGAGRWPTSLAVIADVDDVLEARAPDASALPARSAHR
jgi:homoserine dehydrogenase